MHKVVKIKKRYYTDLEFMYEDLGLVTMKDGKKHVNPSNVLISNEDYKKMKKALKEKLGKSKFISSKKRDMQVNMHLLNLGPNETLGKGICPGYLIIMDDQ